MQIDMSKEVLLEHLIRNKETHRADFEEAVENYRKKAGELLNRWLDELKVEGKVVRLYANLPVPEEHTKSYDRAIRMVRNHVGETIALKEEEYEQYVDDDWGWRRSFASNTLSYTSKASAE